MNSVDPGLLLSLDTASLGGSVCLMRGPKVLASVTGDATVSHSSTLLRDIDFVLNTSRASIQDVALFAASVGPGSFTGLRIGLATVKGLAATLGRPCAGIPTLQAVAFAAGSSEATVALLPAGRGELFCQLLSVSADGTVAERDVAAHLPPIAVIEKYGHLAKLNWAGRGAEVYRDFILENAAARGFNLDDESAPTWQVTASVESLAPAIGALAGKRFQAGKGESAESIQAIYVRPSDPELREGCR